MNRQEKPKRITVNDVASGANVSIATVSYVLSGRKGVSISAPTRARVLNVAQQLGYRRNGLAAALRTGRLNTIGIVCPIAVKSTSELQTHTYISNSLLALTAAAARRGMNTVLFFGDTTADLAAEDLADGRVDGVVVLWGAGRERWLESLVGTSLPCVEIGSDVGDYSVSPDDEGGVRQAVRYLAELGHRHLCYFADTFEAPYAMGRLRAFQLEAKPLGIYAEHSTDLRSVLGSIRRPTGIICFNDECALTALRISDALEISVPREISIIGFDDDLRAISTSPQLTTVRNPMDATAAAALDLVLDIVNGAHPPRRHERVPTELIIRGSTGSTALGA